ncbi:MAG: ABC transporter permease [Nocardioidaceae bacterium]
MAVPLSTTSTPVTTPGRLEMLGRQFDYWLTVYKRTWKGTVVTSFVLPLLYVVAMGVLLGGFVDASGRANLDGAPPYLAFVAPGMVAAQAMTTAIGEVTYPVMGMIKWHRTYFAMVATPLAVPDIVTAHLLFVGFRVATTCAVFFVVMSFFGVFTSAVGVLAAFPVCVLLGLAFAAPIYAFSAHVKSESAFALIFRLLMIPLFLFSGAFFPISNLPTGLEWLARVTPLWQGVDLVRQLVLGQVDAPLALVHVLYLVALTAVGWWLAVRSLTRRLAL